MAHYQDLKAVDDWQFATADVVGINWQNISYDLVRVSAGSEGDIPSASDIGNVLFPGMALRVSPEQGIWYRADTTSSATITRSDIL